MKPTRVMSRLEDMMMLNIWRIVFRGWTYEYIGDTADGMLKYQKTTSQFPELPNEIQLTEGEAWQRAFVRI